MALERAVVGIDGSGGGDDALTWAIEWMQRAGGEVIAVYALGLLWKSRTGHPVPTQEHLDEIRNRFEHEWLATLDRSGVPARKVLRDGTAASVLLGVAAEESADLVVVGKRGTGRFDAALLGSSALQVAEHAPCPVLIVPDGHPPGQVDSVVVGIDGSAPAERALRWAVDLARLVDASLTVAHAVDDGSAVSGAAERVAAIDDEVLHELDTWCAPLADAGVDAHRVVEQADAAELLIRLSQVPGTVVVVGSRGQGGFDELRMGAVSHRVVHHAASPVVVVRSNVEGS